MSNPVFRLRLPIASVRWLRLFVLFAAVWIIGGLVSSVSFAQHPEITAADPNAHAAPHAEAHHGLSPDAPVLYHGIGGHPATDSEPAKIGPFAATNSMLVTWIVAIVVIAFAQYATRRIKEIPDGAQNFWEWLVESLHDFLESIIGHDLVKKTFWFFATIFIFILFTNWAGLIPGVGTIGWGIPNAQGGLEHISRPLFRGVNADLNMTLAMAVVFFVCWVYWALQANGPGGFILHIFGPKGDTTGALKVLMIGVFVLVGVLEVVSIMFRPVSLSFRLYGNVFAGENMLESMAQIVPGLSWLIPVPFYFMELLVGLVQALVFMLLTAVFTLLITQHDEKAHH
ncbi:MAG: synthase subunit a [Chthoniobacter sp.]|jgi:F-type H+-transporting ATPase subunit a|nr:synthase subunit a [Chthoniobacter sp.]